MRDVASVIVLSLVLCDPVFAQTPDKGQGAGDAEVTEQTAPSTTAAGTTQAQTSGPLPTGLSKKGALPHGLDKQGKTPRGWSQGKAWWKHPDQSSHRGSFSSGARGGRPQGAGSAHSNPGRGHR